jgi:DNA transposition AAA+ family ATPase
MNKKFIITKNVKKFIELTDTLKKAPPNLPKMALVYGDFGLGKSQTILWWVTNNDAIYIRCNYKMSGRWLLSEIVEELDEIPYYQSSQLFKQIEEKLKFNPKILVIDEIDFLLNNASVIEVVRDLHDKIGIPIILVGMNLAEQKFKRHKHIYDRLLGVLKFQTFDKNDVIKIVKEMSEVNFSEEALEIIASKFNQFRQLVKFINKVENIAKMNNLDLVTLDILQGFINA